MDASQNAPSLSQAIRIKKLAQQGEFDYDAVYNIMNEEKKSELDTVTIKNETLRKYFHAITRPGRWKASSSSCSTSGN